MSLTMEEENMHKPKSEEGEMVEEIGDEEGAPFLYRWTQRKK